MIRAERWKSRGAPPQSLPPPEHFCSRRSDRNSSSSFYSKKNREGISLRFRVCSSIDCFCCFCWKCKNAYNTRRWWWSYSELEKCKCNCNRSEGLIYIAVLALWAASKVSRWESKGGRKRKWKWRAVYKKRQKMSRFHFWPSPPPPPFFPFLSLTWWLLHRRNVRRPWCVRRVDGLAKLPSCRKTGVVVVFCVSY